MCAVVHVWSEYSMNKVSFPISSLLYKFAPLGCPGPVQSNAMVSWYRKSSNAAAKLVSVANVAVPRRSCTASTSSHRSSEFIFLFLFP